MGFRERYWDLRIWDLRITLLFAASWALTLGCQSVPPSYQQIVQEQYAEVAPRLGNHSITLDIDTESVPHAEYTRDYWRRELRASGVYSKSGPPLTVSLHSDSGWLVCEYRRSEDPYRSHYAYINHQTRRALNPGPSPLERSGRNLLNLTTLPVRFGLSLVTAAKDAVHVVEDFAPGGFYLQSVPCEKESLIAVGVAVAVPLTLGYTYSLLFGPFSEDLGTATPSWTYKVWSRGWL